MSEVRDNRHFEFLDALRGIAILLVVSVHVGQVVPGLPVSVAQLSNYGAKGVQLFFVVSGYTLSLVYYGRTFVAKEFFLRRYFRIAPMFYVGLVLNLVFNYFDPQYKTFNSFSLSEVIATLFFVHGWFPAFSNKMVLGGWSIASEAMFYISFPFILSIMRSKVMLFCFTISSYLVAALFFYLLKNYYPNDNVTHFSYFFWLVQWPAFLSGCALVHIVPILRPFPNFREFGFYAIVVVLVIFSQVSALSSYLVATILWVGLTACASSVNVILRNKMLCDIGKVSFSIYVLHFFVIRLVQRYLAYFPENNLSRFIILYVCVTVVAWGAARLTFLYVEKPFIELAKRLPKSANIT